MVIEAKLTSHTNYKNVIPQVVFVSSNLLRCTCIDMAADSDSIKAIGFAKKCLTREATNCDSYYRRGSSDLAFSISCVSVVRRIFQQAVQPVQNSV